jgi:hypothetical protein
MYGELDTGETTLSFATQSSTEQLPARISARHKNTINLSSIRL